jgi:hypothetical protein
MNPHTVPACRTWQYRRLLPVRNRPRSNCSFLLPVLICLSVLWHCLADPSANSLILYINAENGSGYADGTIQAPYPDFQSAVAEASRLKERIILSVAGGRYEESVNIRDFTSGLEILGDKSDPFILASGNTVLEIEDSSVVLLRDGILESAAELALSVLDSRQISLKRMVLECAHACIQAEDTSKFHLENSTIEHNEDLVEEVFSSGQVLASWKDCDQLLVQYTTFSGGTVQARVDGKQSRLVYNSFRKFVQSGLELKGGEPFVAETSWSTDNSGTNGMSLDTVTGARFAELDMQGGGPGSDGAGILISGSTDTIMNDVVIRDFHYGMDIVDSEDVDISLTELSGNDTGLRSQKSDVLFLESSTVDNVTGVHGVDSDLDVLFTMVTDNSGWGVILEDQGEYEGSRYRIRGASEVRNNGLGGIQILPDDANVRVIIVTFSGNGGYAIEGPSTADADLLECSNLTLESGETIDPDLSGTTCQ